LGLAVIAEEYRAELRSYKLDLAISGGSRIELFRTGGEGRPYR
jgi:glyoxylase I family protein